MNKDFPRRVYMMKSKGVVRLLRRPSMTSKTNAHCYYSAVMSKRQQKNRAAIFKTSMNIQTMCPVCSS